MQNIYNEHIIQILNNVAPYPALTSLLILVRCHPHFTDEETEVQGDSLSPHLMIQGLLIEG